MATVLQQATQDHYFVTASVQCATIIFILWAIGMIVPFWGVNKYKKNRNTELQLVRKVFLRVSGFPTYAWVKHTTNKIHTTTQQIDRPTHKFEQKVFIIFCAYFLELFHRSIHPSNQPFRECSSIPPSSNSLWRFPSCPMWRHLREFRPTAAQAHPCWKWCVFSFFR